MAWCYLELPGLGNLAWAGALHTQSLGGFSQGTLACPSTKLVFEPRVKGGECSADLPLRYYRMGLVRLAGNARKRHQLRLAGDGKRNHEAFRVLARRDWD